MGDWTGTVPTILAGYIPTGDQWDTVLDIETALTAAWTSYSVTWTAVTANPVLGNGTLTGAYQRIGKLVMVRIVLVAGTTTTFGTGAWLFSLPAIPQADQTLGAFVNDSSTSNRWAGDVWITTASATGDNMRIVVQDNTAGVASAVPMAWATSDRLIIQGIFETT